MIFEMERMFCRQDLTILSSLLSVDIGIHIADCEDSISMPGDGGIWAQCLPQQLKVIVSHETQVCSSRSPGSFHEPGPAWVSMCPGPRARLIPLEDGGYIIQVDILPPSPQQQEQNTGEAKQVHDHGFFSQRFSRAKNS